MLDLLEEFRSILSSLAERRVEAAVCGGLAMAIHARPRATLDIDLLVPSESLEGAKDVVRGLGYVIEADPFPLAGGAVEIHRLSKPDEETGDLLSVDLLRVTPQLQGVWDERVQVSWEFGTVPVVSRKGLIAMKTLRGSGQDADDIQALAEEDDR